MRLCSYGYRVAPVFVCILKSFRDARFVVTGRVPASPGQFGRLSRSVVARQITTIGGGGDYTFARKFGHYKFHLTQRIFEQRPIGRGRDRGCKIVIYPA